MLFPNPINLLINKSWRTIRATLSSYGFKKLFSGLLWLTAGSVPSRAASLLATILVARILGKLTYGELTLARSTVNAFVTVASFGMGRAAAKFVAELLETDKARVGRIAALNYVAAGVSSFVIAVVYYFFADFLCTRMIDAPHLAFQVRLCSPLLVFTAIAGAQIGVLTGFQSYREIACASTISGFAMIPFYVLGAKFGGLTGATLGFTSGSALTCVCNSFFISRLLKTRGVKYDFRGCFSETPVLWNFCLPSTLLSLLSSAATWAICVLLAARPNGAAELGVFDAARQIQTAVLYLPVLAANIVVPMLSELNGRNAADQYAKTARWNVLANAAFTSFVALFFIIFARATMRCFGADFEPGASTLVVLMATSVFMSVANVCGSVLTSLGALWTRFFYTLLWAAISVGGTLLFAKTVPGALGVAFAMGIAYAVQTVGMSFSVRRALRMRSKQIQAGLKDV